MKNFLLIIPLFFICANLASSQTRMQTYITTDSGQQRWVITKAEQDSIVLRYKTEKGDSSIKTFHVSQIKFMETTEYVPTSYYSLGIVIGSPGIFNLSGGYLSERIGGRLTAGFGPSNYGFALDITNTFYNRKHTSITSFLRGQYEYLKEYDSTITTFDSTFKTEHKYTIFQGPSILFGLDLNYYGFYIGYGFGYGKNSFFSRNFERDANDKLYIDPNKWGFALVANLGYVYEFK